MNVTRLTKREMPDPKRIVCETRVGLGIQHMGATSHLYKLYSEDCRRRSLMIDTIVLLKLLIVSTFAANCWDCAATSA